jgi:zinc transport system ATP-binding protein
MNKQPVLEVSNLSVSLNQQQILKDICFNVYCNETVAVIGPNGAGKTTLFRALLDLIPYTGTVKWQENIKIGYVPQRLSVDADLPLTVRDFFNLKGDISDKQVNEVLETVSLRDNTKLLSRKLGHLSGGELQRVLIAWALLGKPDVLLFDEPTAGIDVSTEETIYTLLEKIKDKHHLTIMLISHELEVVYKYATNVICLNKKQVCFGPPKEMLDKDSITKLFGENTGLYHHHEHD